jgi:mannose-6-phosphate isomerase-like protein (cupin superfamily)
VRTGAQRASPSYSQAARSHIHVRILRIRRYFCHADSTLIPDQQVRTSTLHPPFLRSRFTAAPGFNTGDHIHRQIEEIFYVVEGEFQIRAGDRALRPKPGDFVLVPPGSFRPSSFSRR